MGDDRPRTPEIEPQEFIGGVTVVDIGDLRVARGLSRRPFSGCVHRRLVYDEKERRVWCKDCETDVEGFDAFVLVVRHWAQAAADIKDRLKAVKAAEDHALISIAAKTVDKAWRSKMVPACPHCGHGLFPEHFKHSPAELSRQYATDRLSNDPLRRMRTSTATKDGEQ